MTAEPKAALIVAHGQPSDPEPAEAEIAALYEGRSAGRDVDLSW